MTGRPPLRPAGAEQPRRGDDAARASTTAQNAPLVRRLAAVVYEGLLLSAVLLIAGFLLAPVVSPAPAAAERLLPAPALPARIASFAAMFGVGALYFGWSWSGGRRTLPMKTWRMRLVPREGRAAVAFRTALARYCAAWIGPALALGAYAALAPTGHPRTGLLLAAFNYAWAWVDPDRAFLHDRLAGTRIVAESRPA